MTREKKGRGKESSINQDEGNKKTNPSLTFQPRKLKVIKSYLIASRRKRERRGERERKRERYRKGV